MQAKIQTVEKTYWRWLVEKFPIEYFLLEKYSFHENALQVYINFNRYFSKKV